MRQIKVSVTKEKDLRVCVFQIDLETFKLRELVSVQ